mmetsp:Transcript_24359/g.38579  ORF Transcript_24359/g.38579 Transcript_24359/m.38579 type:complete len:204 (-) Transcript_24359:95-706(-)|eukprot:CAMPEP_0197022038 /NCGR_PEP_ID=MMETSP1384-20130603/2956_1 /TAXON_ID=29189 /ORGANISM="Ammonia sp." /LENGTH=203 /DNA_ID=CAMNT_0042450001 /DNA_START=36 /DNA_END=647 /DNA_ORIENTATION=+
MGKFVMKTGNNAQIKKMMNIKAKLKAAKKIKEMKRKEDEQYKVDAQGTKHESKPDHFSELFFRHNKALGPPYHVICDTNFFYYARKAKKDIFTEMTRILLAKCYLYVTDCIIGEAEKMGRKYKSMLRSIKDPRIRRLKCQHKGIYADDCICNRVNQHRIFLVATCDRDLKKRLRKIPGVPIVYIQAFRFTVEKLPEGYGAPRF